MRMARVQLGRLHGMTALVVVLLLASAAPAPERQTSH